MIWHYQCNNIIPYVKQKNTLLFKVKKYYHIVSDVILITKSPMTNLEEIDKSLNDWKFYELHSIMGKKWNLLILIAIYEDIHTFSGIMKAIPKINTSILTKRLNELVNKWFITKTWKIWYNLSEKWNLLMEWLESLKQRVIETGRDKQIEKYKKIK